jgi:putative ABC transport system permease protein
MKTLFKIGARNVRRNLRRTLITALAIFIGVIVILLTRGLVNGIQVNLKAMTTETQLGDLQVHRQGYMNSAEGAPLSLNMPDHAVSAVAVRAAGAVAVAPRILFGGMISRADNSTMVIAQSIDPSIEYTVTPRKKDVISQGHALAPEDTGGIVLAEGLAGALGATLGDTVTILTNTESGAMNAADFTVVGLMAPASPFENKRAAVIQLADAQTLLGMRGKVTEFAVRLPPDMGDARLDLMRDKLAAAVNTGAEKFEVHTWRDLMPQIKDIIRTQDAVLALVIGVLFFIVLVGIVNTMLMSVFERVREVGTLMAMGMRGHQVIVMFIFEALTLGVIGATAGAIAGMGIVSLLNQAGLQMAPPGASVKMVLQVVLSQTYPLKAMGIAIVSALIAAVYPAWQASKLKPIDAIRNH